jgi:sugar lactone lactonase YvrE
MKKFTFTRKCAWLCLGLFLLLEHSPAQGEGVGSESGRWQLAPGSRVEEFLGRRALTFSGNAFIKDVEFTNGVVEVDLAFKEGQVFPTIIFRRRDDANCEEFYVRPHKSGQPDALQYSPVINGLSAWQLYYGEGYTNAWKLPTNTWMHIKIEFAGTQARVFVGEEKNPALVIPELKRAPDQGGVGLKVTGPIGLAYFSDFHYRRDDTLKFDPPIKNKIPWGMISDWEVSQSFPYNRVDMQSYPSRELLSQAEWKKVTSEPDGLVNVARYARKGPVVPGCILAKTTIDSRTERPLDLQFGYSDVVSVFLNGRLLFRGSNVFLSRDPFFQGRVGLFDTLALPLRKGDNELLFMLAESMGGWGYMARMGDAVYQDKSLRPLWTLAHELSYPETVVYDPGRDVLYVSNFLSDGTQSVSRLKMNGEIDRFEWIGGLARPTGMAIRRDTLFIVERANMVEVDIPSGRIVKRYPAPASVFLNDIALDADGSAYISDSQKGEILKFSNGQLSSWKSGPELGQVNGLHCANGRLYAGVSADASLKSIDLKSGEIQTVAKLDRGANIDGIEADEKGNILVSDFNGKILLVKPEGKTTLLLDTSAPKRYCANFAYIPGKRMLVIPSFPDNCIRAFALSPNEE